MKYLFAIYLVFSVFFTSFSMLIYQNINQVLFSQTDAETISMYFQDDVTRDFVESKVSQLTLKYELKSAIIHSPADQYAEFVKSFTMYSPGAFDAEEIIQLTPYLVDFTLSPHQNKQDIKKLLVDEKIFQETGTSSEWLDKLQSLAGLARGAGKFLFLFLFAGTALLTVATVRILILKDEYKNKIYSYLGQSFYKIYRYYLIRIGALYFLSVATGILLNYCIHEFFIFKIKSNLQFSFLASRLHFLTYESLLIIAAGFLTAFMLGAVFSLQHLHRKIYAEE